MINGVMYFVETENLVKRTNDSFRNKFHLEHHVGETLFINIPGFNIIDNVPLDYMHNLLLGGTKRLLCNKRYGWIFGKPPHKLRAKDVNDITNLLFKLRKYILCEFSRKTRCIVECKRYKATEFRLFLLYTGPIVLRQVPPKVYNNFITLSLASTILISNHYSKYEHFISYAHELMKHFLTNCIQIYGPDFISYNIHSFLHLSDCVRLFGSLDNFSAFPFENFMQKLKKMVRKTSQPLQQVVRRIVEQNNILRPTKNTDNNLSIGLLMEHSDGPLINTCNPPQYKKLKTTEYCLNINRIADRFVELKNKTIIEIKNFVSHENSVFLGYSYSIQNDFYSKPCNSSFFDIQYIKKKYNLLEMWSIDDINRKLVVLPFRDQYVSFPLLHL